MPTSDDGPSKLFRPLMRDQEIRLLRVRPNSDYTAPLDCAMRTISLDEYLIYETISYAWGDPATRTTVSVDGNDLSITTSLADALRCFRIRDHEPPRTWLWADAICINQSDPVERSQQVAIMHRIYSQAANVRIWLGQGLQPDGEEDRLAAQAMQILVSWQANLESCGDYDAPASDEELQALAHLISVPYWRRTWLVALIPPVFQMLTMRGRVIQEVALAHSTTWFCGTHEAHISSQLARLLDDLPVRKGPALSAMKYARRALYAARCEDIHWPALGLIQAAQTAQCTDRRDHVYALLGLIDQLSGMKVDYTTPIQEVYKNATLQLMRRTRSIDTLVIGSRSADRQGPSWIIPFERLQPRNTLDPSILATGDFDPSRGARFWLETPCSGQLDVLGYNVDVVKRVYAGMEDWDWSTSNTSVCEMVEGWRAAYLKHIEDFQARHVSPEPCHAFWRAMLWGASENRPNARLQYDILERSLQEGTLESALATTSISNLADSSFFVTRGGLFGLAIGATSVVPGDFLHVLAGCGHPICLRKTDAVDDTFTVIAPAYVDGIMEGQAVLQEARRRFPDKRPEQHVNELFDKLTLI